MTTESTNGETERSSCNIGKVAGALTISRNAFPDDLTYEVKGDVLTWIVHGEQPEIRIDCHNATEVIDGFYRAEYFLDTRKILDPYTEFHAGIRYVEPETDVEPEVEPNAIVSQHSILEAIKIIRDRQKAKLKEEKKRNGKLEEELNSHSCSNLDYDELYTEVEENLGSCTKIAADSATSRTSPVPPATPVSGVTVEASDRKFKGNKSENTKEGNTSDANETVDLRDSIDSSDEACPISLKCVRVMNKNRSICKETMNLVLNARNAIRAKPVSSGNKISSEKAESQEVCFMDPKDPLESHVSYGEIPGTLEKQDTHLQEGMKIIPEGSFAEESNSYENILDLIGDNSSLGRRKRGRELTVFRNYHLPIDKHEWVTKFLMQADKAAI